MSIPLLTVKPSSQNQRVDGYEVANEETPTIYRAEDATDPASVDALIWAAYRQVYSEHEILDGHRQSFLESQLRNNMISVRDFVRGLGKSEPYYRLVVETNSNYRVVEVSLKRILGRAPYNQAEKITWSIVIAEKGLSAFIDALVDSEEYQQNFGESTVPYQRRRYKDRPFNLVTPRYGSDWRAKLERDYPKQGDIKNFLDMARQISPRTAQLKPVSTAKINIPDMTRKSDNPAPVSVRGSFRFPI